MSLNAYQTEFLSKLLSIPSVGGDSLDAAPYGHKPLEALDFFLNKASEAGFTTGKLDNKVGFVEIGSGEKLIGIVCHLDVVPEGDGWKVPPFALTELDGKLYGRGIVDDKGPAAASFFAMKYILDNELLPENTRIRLILGTDEERTCSCVEYYAEHGEIPSFSITPDAEYPAIYCEKGILHLKIKGDGLKDIEANGGNAANMVPAKATFDGLGLKIETIGKPAHGSRPELGINAITLLINELKNRNVNLSEIPVLNYLDEFNAADFTGCVMGDESGELTYNPGILKIDDDEQSIVIDFRVPYSYDLEDVVKNVAQSATIYGLEVEVISSMDSIYMDKDSKQIKCLTDIWEKHMDKFSGFKEEYREMYSQPLAIGGGTYARHLPNTVAFGVQAPWQVDQCHQANERVEESDYLEWIEIIKETILKLA
ncbi:MAG: Sapep family Mn(2+)-dependent dipeptidase [Saccharofermentans sp.]|nr:Sapep family Mn(2+)-dependent dipeptidase [Saccharofermentans sp.]